MEAHHVKTLYLSTSPPQRRAIFTFSIVAAVLITLILNMIGQPLITTAAPAGIVSFELAGTNAHAQLILDFWDTRAKQFAAFSLGFDYLYMLAYAERHQPGLLVGCDGSKGARLAFSQPRRSAGDWLMAGGWFRRFGKPGAIHNFTWWRHS